MVSETFKPAREERKATNNKHNRVTQKVWIQSKQKQSTYSL